MMGSDIDVDAMECEIHRAGILAMRKRAAELRAELCESRGLTPSQACQVGCSTCGVIDASPSRCEFCAHGASTWHDTQPAVHQVGRGHIAAETPDTEGGAE